MKHFVVELQSPLSEPQLSRVASEVASELALTEVKLSKLLGRGAGPLTKLVNKPVAEKVAETLRAAGGDVAVVNAAVGNVTVGNVAAVAYAGVAPAEVGEAGARGAVVEDPFTPSPLTAITDPTVDPTVSSFTQPASASAETHEHSQGYQAETVEEAVGEEAAEPKKTKNAADAATPNTKNKPTSGPWFVLGSVLMVAVLAVLVYGVWLR